MTTVASKTPAPLRSPILRISASRAAASAKAEGFGFPSDFGFRISDFLAGFRIFFLLLLTTPALAADPSADFDQANRLYEQGKYAEAAAAYEALITAGHGTPALYYNLGNAWFKAGQDGRAIAAYRRAEQSTPRDPNLRFNLDFVRKKVTGTESPALPAWPAVLTRLTLNEWAILVAASLWIFWALLVWAELRPAHYQGLKKYLAASGLLAVIFGGCIAARIYFETHLRPAVVTVPQAVVRYGPLEESQVFYQLRDGSEIVVLDEKPAPDNQVWLQVRDFANRIGWLRRDQVMVL